jgi:hypothetical protein
MNKLQLLYLGFLLKLIYGAELVIFHCDKVLTSLARCLIGMWSFVEQSLVLLGVQKIQEMVWKLIDWKVFN